MLLPFLVTRLGLLVTRLGREDNSASIAIKYLIATYLYWQSSLFFISIFIHFFCWYLKLYIKHGVFLARFLSHRTRKVELFGVS